jgi:hypothetical protein
MRHTDTTVSLERFKSKAPRTLSLPMTWRNWVGVLAVFFGLLGQTLHTHALTSVSSVAKDHAVVTASAQDVDTCPLCVAMHSTLPVADAVPSNVMVADEPSLVADATNHVPDQAWHFARFSRPPPVVGII